MFRLAGWRNSDKITPADPRDLADALAFALRYQGRNGIISEIVAKRLVDYLERAGFVGMKRAQIVAAQR